jgi:hypothetical protein
MGRGRDKDVEGKVNYPQRKLRTTWYATHDRRWGYIRSVGSGHGRAIEMGSAIG